ncbi:MAG TPA: SdrD B-like domain-containing protein [Longimicrobiales bacterium]|nr:SdrD B-like domain-containing protein [Longimicrobiales bacterium]
MRKLLLPILVLAAACDPTLEDRILEVTATGDIGGIVFFDRNGTGVMDDGDTPLAGVNVHLALTRHPVNVLHSVTDGSGIFLFPGVPVGEYRFVFEHAAIGDTIQVMFLNPHQVRLQPGDSIPVTTSVTYPFAGIRQFREDLPVGRKVFVEGVALNTWGVFSDSSLHIAAGDRLLRATLVRPVDIVEDDSVRLLGTRRIVNGQPVIDDVRAFRIARAAGGWLVPGVSTGEAATAADGALDAALIRVTRAVVADSADVVGRYRRVVVDDGSGPLEVLMEEQRFNAFRPGPGDRFDITGLLVPSADSPTWVLRPRRAEDIRPS